MQRVSLWKRSVGIMAVSGGLLLGGSLLSSVQAATAVCPPCGFPLGPGGLFVLTCDVTLCTTNPALSVDSATLDMNGHTVSCLGPTPTNDGIVLLGSKAKLRNGTVTGCFNGVVLQGTGHHEVRNVTSSYNANIGFEELEGSSANKLTNDTASYNGTLIDGHSGGSGCDFVEGGAVLRG